MPIGRALLQYITPICCIQHLLMLYHHIAVFIVENVDSLCTILRPALTPRFAIYPIMPVIYPVIQQSDLDEYPDLNSFMVQAGLCEEIIDLYATLTVCSDISTQSYSTCPLVPSQSRLTRIACGLYGGSGGAIGRPCLILPQLQGCSLTRFSQQPCDHSNCCNSLVTIQSRPSNRDSSGAGGPVVAQGRCSHPVQTSRAQEYMDMRSFCTTRYAYLNKSHIFPAKLHLFMCIAHLLLLYTTW